jgi:hypothetical protein
MGVRPLLRCSRVVLVLLTVGCHLPEQERPALAPTEYTPGLLAPRSEVIARAAAPSVPEPALAPATPPPLPGANASTPSSTIPPPVATKFPPLMPIRETEPPIALPANLPPVTEPPGALPVRSAPGLLTLPASGAQPKSVSPGEFLPPIPVLPDSPLPAPAKPKPAPRTSDPPVTRPAPSELPKIIVAPPAPSETTGPIELSGNPVTFDVLSKLVDGNICPGCGGGVGFGGCETCGGPQCRAGGKRCEPFPAHTAAGRVIGLIYTSVCCPDPCYQPRWEPLADAAFFSDAVRPRTSTRFRWDYADHYIYPDRGEYLFARGDGKGRGPKAFGGLKGIPFTDYHDLVLVTEIGMGAAGVQIAMPYRSVNSTPFGQDGAGFSDMTITAKTMLLDTELALFGFQMRTYIPIGNVGKGVGTGHVSLEPGLNFGLRCTPSTYLQAQVVEWIPIGGDKDYQGAHLRWATSINQVLWRPVKEVQCIGMFETTGISWQDGLYTDQRAGTQKLAKRTSAAIGPGFRLFFCDTFDMGVGWQHPITGKYLARDFYRFEVRYRY